jgi:PAS domain S-box-containing protein
MDVQNDQPDAERVDAHAAFAASEEQYRLAVDAARIGTWSLDLATDAVAADERTRDLLALTEADVASRNNIIATRVHPDDRQRLRGSIEAAANPAGDGRFQGEYRIVRPDGSERWALASGRVYFVGEGAERRAVKLIGTVLDVTDRKRAESRDRILARLGADLLVTANEHVALQRLADASVGELADWAIVDVIEIDGVSARRAAMAHVDPAKLAVMRELAAKYPPDPRRPTLGRDALATGRASLYPDVSDAMMAAIAHDAEQARLAREMGFRSAIAVPLQTRRGPFGIAAFGSGSRVFTADDVNIAEELGRRAALAVENARLVATAQHARHEAERAASRTGRLQALSAALASALTSQDVAAAAVRDGVSALGADAGLIVVTAPDGEVVDILRSQGYAEANTERWRRFTIDSPVPLAEAIRTGEPVVVASRAELEQRYPVLDTSVSIKYPASISVPLMAEGRSFGALGLSFTNPIDVTPEDRDLLLAVARQCAQAMRRATLFEAEAVARAAAEAAGRRLSLLAEASALLASLDYEVTLQQVAQLAVPSFADYVAIDLVDVDGGPRRVATAHANPAKAELLRSTARFYPRAGGTGTPLRDALTGGEPLLIVDVDDEWLQRATRSPEQLDAARALGPISLIVAPLSARDNTLGVISFVMAESSRRYGPNDVALAVDLAHRAAAAVDNARLYRQSESAREDAEAASRAKGQFLAVMSHELRTPLNAILGYSELVEMGVHGAVTDAQLEAMTRIRRSGQHLLSLVNNVLNLERSEAGTIQTEFAALPIVQLFEDADALTRPQAEAKGITLTVETPPADAMALGERDKAQQVLVNLLSNAVKFTPRGGRITVTCLMDAASVQLCVADSGIGIPADSLDRAFEPFVQLETGLTRRAEGAGLGLAISRRLARLMGGDLTAESEVGQGSTFTLTLVRVPTATVA